MEERARPSFWQMLWLGFKMTWVPRRIWVPHYRTCLKCPLFNRVTRQCRPYPGSPLGCGCWMPLKARAYFTWRGCWGRLNLPPVSNIGWRK